MMVAFSAIYLGRIRRSDDPLSLVNSYKTSLYFSGITQATVGYGDVVPATAFAKGSAVAQSALGTVWFSLTVAIVSVRLLLPNQLGIEFEPLLAFNPISHRFEAPIVSYNRGSISRVRASMHWVTGGTIPPVIDRLSVPYLLKETQRLVVKTATIPLRPIAGNHYVPVEHISPQPADIGRGCDVVLEIEFTTSFGTEAFSQQHYKYENIVCGVYPSGGGPITRIEAAPETAEYCSVRCPFGQTCDIQNKVRPALTP